MHNEGIKSETIDLLQGRIPKLIFARYYHHPDIKSILNEIRAKIPKLRELILDV